MRIERREIRGRQKEGADIRDDSCYNPIDHSSEVLVIIPKVGDIIKCIP